MKINGTIINYYFHCKRQCYLFANRINLEDNSEDVRIGRIIHEIRAEDGTNTEIKYDNMAMDKITDKYVIELKKSDSDVEAAKMQLLFYLQNLQNKGISKEGKLIFYEKNNNEKIEKIILNKENINKLNECENQIEKLLQEKLPPKIVKQKGCQKCAYYEYCFL